MTEHLRKRPADLIRAQAGDHNSAGLVVGEAIKNVTSQLMMPSLMLRDQLQWEWVVECEDTKLIPVYLCPMLPSARIRIPE